jgi:hypothetical protein
MVTDLAESWCILTPPKTASTTLSQLFRDPHFRAVVTPEQHLMNPPPAARVIVSVRDPWTRAVSLWRHRLQELGDENRSLCPFIQYMEDVCRSRLDDFFCFTLNRWLQHVPRVDDLIRFERLEEDLRAVLPAFDWDAIRIPHENRNPVLTDNHPLRNTKWARKTTIVRNPLADPAARQLVLQWCAEDFVRFGYSTECCGRTGSPERAERGIEV